MIELAPLRKARLKAKAGYTLVEILIVLAIIALLVAIVGPRLFTLFEGAKVKTTTTQIANLKQSLSIMQSDIGRFPTEQEGLNLLVQSSGQGVNNWSGPYLSSGEVPKDGWGNPFVYVAPAEGGEPQVASYGSDGKPGGTGTAADIVK
ncbi:MAG TPA: type II secretion system major pseudopilin GspG [Caulobacteraceae bacterium]|jgi:general secretion pathway protein G|nr:type II secretion system major pseudopilin GspG [Caulobacteraceae bacterium]